MNTRAIIPAVTLALTSVLLGGASRSEIIGHTTPRLPGNSIPEGSRALCGALPDESALIAGLETGWAFPVASSSSIRFVFSTEVLACREPNSGGPSPGQACNDGWTLAFTLPGELLTPGVHNLKDYEINFVEYVTTAVTGKGCQSGGCSGGGGGGAKRDVTIEIDTVTDGCITGSILQWDSGYISPRIEFTGAFHAVRCTLAESSTE
jgi:hypothetical protein